MKNWFLALGLLAAACICSAEPMLADSHAANGVTCQACHASQPPGDEDIAPACIACHPVKALLDKTSSVKPANPHTSPHYRDELECNACHAGHKKGEDFCTQCHKFNFNVR